MTPTLAAHIPGILAPEFEADPYSSYSLMRDEAPVYYDDQLQAYVLSRYADVARAFKDPAFTNRNYEWQLEPVHGRTIVQMDGREHATKRAIVAPSFRPKVLFGQLAPIIETNAVRLVDEFVARGGCEYSSEFSRLYPINVTADMMGLPVEDLETFRGWYTAIIDFLGNLTGDEDIAAAGIRARDAMAEYMLPIIADRRENPGDDLLSTLCTAEVDGTRMSDEEIKSFASLLLTAGGETTDKVLTSLVAKLVEHPDQLADVRRDRSLIAAALAETLRVAPPLHMVMRQTAEEIDIAGTSIPEGSTVICLIASANRDPATFAAPDCFDIHRTDVDAAREFSGASKQLAFVHGRHFCVGSLLAKQEVEVGINVLLDRTSDIRLSEGFVPVEEGVFTRAPRRLLLDLTPAT
ncbi:cytochrome P450 [Pseudonocardia endophytica]|uniref:Pulcherriminic acid synthase n=1 Tax=Pseudonocardia endophytica TaxID=401976 RepID=A0A4R1HGU5_PSEEN|nr:cytochrome P450 [Pseudonocardia endophytica]TCK21414.1 pulcherriminic acid synthase [Pseudonocardia endophytica]